MSDNLSQQENNVEKIKDIIIEIAHKVNENEKKPNSKTDKVMIREIEEVIERNI